MVRHVPANRPVANAPTSHSQLVLLIEWLVVDLRDMLAIGSSSLGLLSLFYYSVSVVTSYLTLNEYNNFSNLPKRTHISLDIIVNQYYQKTFWVINGTLESTCHNFFFSRIIKFLSDPPEETGSNSEKQLTASVPEVTPAKLGKKQSSTALSIPKEARTVRNYILVYLHLK